MTPLTFNSRPSTRCKCNCIEGETERERAINSNFLHSLIVASLFPLNVSGALCNCVVRPFFLLRSGGRVFCVEKVMSPSTSYQPQYQETQNHFRLIFKFQCVVEWNCANLIYVCRYSLPLYLWNAFCVNVTACASNEEDVNDKIYQNPSISIPSRDEEMESLLSNANMQWILEKKADKCVFWFGER